jgi:hypothetical protein
MGGIDQPHKFVAHSNEVGIQYGSVVVVDPAFLLSFGYFLSLNHKKHNFVSIVVVLKWAVFCKIVIFIRLA